MSTIPHRSVARGASTVGFFTLLSRVAGLVRDTVFAHFFGVSHATDAFLMAFTIPNTFRNLVAEGALTVAFLPVFRDVERERGPEASRRMFAQTMGVSMVLVVTLVAICILLSDAIVAAFAGGFSRIPGKLEATVTLTRQLFPYLSLVSFVALSMGALNARRRFAMSAASPLFFNLAFIAGAVAAAFSSSDPMQVQAWWVLVGGVIQVVLQIVELKRCGLWTRPQLTLSPEVRRVLLLMAPAVGSLAVYQLNIVVIRFFSSHLDTAAVSLLFLADRLMQLPLGVFGIAIATASLPAFADAHAENDGVFANAVASSMRLTNAVLIPAAVGLGVLSLPICTTLFQHGRFSFDMALQAASVLGAFAFGLVPVGGIRVAAQAFFAAKDTRTPLLCSALGLLSNLALAPLLSARWQTFGLAMAVSASAWLQWGLQLWLLRRRLPSLPQLAIAKSARIHLVAALVMAATLSLVPSAELWQTGVGWSQAALLALSMLAGGVVYAVVALLFRSEELSRLVSVLRRRVRTSCDPG